jgi:large subunit ribosomal protein L17
MWHRRRRRRLGVSTNHRKALLRNLVASLAFHHQIETTLARAKETSRLADRMVTLAKGGTLAARRQLIRHLASPEAAKVFIEVIAPRLQDRQGGYTRVLKTENRPGDGTQMALVEFSVPIEMPAKEAKRPKKEKKPKPPKPVREEKEKEKEIKRPVKPAEAKKEEKKEKAPKPEEEEAEKRGGFLSKLRKFLTGD